MTTITRDNVDELLDAGRIQVAMRNGRWWAIRRNGKTQKWKRDPERIRIPFKCGLRGYGAVEASDFSSGELNAAFYRVVEMG